VFISRSIGLDAASPFTLAIHRRNRPTEIARELFLQLFRAFIRIVPFHITDHHCLFSFRAVAFRFCRRAATQVDFPTIGVGGQSARCEPEDHGLAVATPSSASSAACRRTTDDFFERPGSRALPCSSSQSRHQPAARDVQAAINAARSRFPPIFLASPPIES